MVAPTFEPWLQSLADDLMELVGPETARARFREHVNEWCADPKPDVHLMPPRRNRAVILREKYVALAAIHDSVCLGSDPLGPDVWAEPANRRSDEGQIFNKPYMAWAVLVHAHVPRLKELHSIGLRGWLLAVKQDLSRRKRKSAHGARKAGVEKRLYAELCTRIKTEQSRIKTDERLSPKKPLQKDLARCVGESRQYICKRLREEPKLKELWDAFGSRQRLLSVQVQ